MLGKNYHKSFRLNGIKFKSIKSLLLYTKGLEIHHFLTTWFNDNDFILVNTSGTTGKPKEIKILKKQMINSALATGKYFDLPEKTVALLCLSSYYIAGKMMLVRALILGWLIDVVEPKTNPLKKLNKKYDFSAMVPMQVEASLNNLKIIDKLIVGGAPISNTLISKLQLVKTKIFATYGMTETITHIAVKKINHYKNETNFEILPNVTITKDNRNCLVIKAPKISETTIITNDLVELTNPNSFKWLGRIDHVINTGGIKVIPESVENKLKKIIKQAFFISSKKDEILGKKLILFIEGKKDNNLMGKIENLNVLSKFEKPKNIFYVKKIIRTKNGKINRKHKYKFY